MLNKFPHIESCLPQQCKYGIVTSQCHRYMITCSEPKYFLQAAVKLRETFMDKNYCERKIDKKFRRFLSAHRSQLRLKPDAIKIMHQHQTKMTKQTQEKAREKKKPVLPQPIQQPVQLQPVQLQPVQLQTAQPAQQPIQQPI